MNRQSCGLIFSSTGTRGEVQGGQEEEGQEEGGGGRGEEGQEGQEEEPVAPALGCAQQRVAS